MTATATETSIRIPQGALREALTAVKPAIPARPVKPIYSSVVLADWQLSAGGGDIWATFGLRLEDRYGVEAPQSMPPMVLHYSRLKAIIDSVPADAVVTLTPAGAAVKVRAGRGAWSLPTEDSAEFANPSPMGKGLRPAGRVPPDQFRRAVRAVAFAADPAAGRAAMQGVLLEQTAAGLHLVATDGRRLAVFEAEVSEAVDDSQTVVPVSALRAAAEMPGDAAIEIDVSSSWVVFTGENWTVSTPVIAGTFPAWKKVMPKAVAKATVTCGRDELLAGLRAAAVCEDEVSRGVVVTIGDKLTLTAKSSGAGSSRVTVPLHEGRDGEALRVKLDPRYVIEWLRSLPGEDACPWVQIQATSADAAVVFTCDDATNVVMPLSQQEGDRDEA